MSKKKKEQLSDTMTNEQKCARAALKMIFDPEFCFEQQSKAYELRMLCTQIALLMDELQEGYLPLMKHTKGIQKFVQYAKNAVTACERLILYTSDINNMLSDSADADHENFSNADEMNKLMHLLVAYMSDEKDTWRWFELKKKIDDLIPVGVRDERIQMTQEYLKGRFPEYYEKEEEFRKLFNI